MEKTTSRSCHMTLQPTNQKPLIFLVMHKKIDTSPMSVCIMLRKEDKRTVDLSLSSHDSQSQPTNQRLVAFCSCADPRLYTPLSSRFTRRELHMCSSSQLRSRRSKYGLGKKPGRKPQLIPGLIIVNFSGAWNRFEKNQFRKPIQPGRPVQQIEQSHRPRLGIDSWAP